MAEGNWSVALYVDERGDAAQRAALQAIFSGTSGGIRGALAPLISTVLGVKTDAAGIYGGAGYVNPLAILS